jgi:hypothetical protein
VDVRNLNEMDWRDQFLYSIAYRITEMKGVEPVVARLWVRDVKMHGSNSEHFPAVFSAIVEMFLPLAGAFMPYVPHLVSAVATVVSQENQRGAAAEAQAKAERAATKS